MEEKFKCEVNKGEKLCYVAMGQFATEQEALKRKVSIEKFPFFIKTKDKVEIVDLRRDEMHMRLSLMPPKTKDYPFNVQVLTDKPEKFMT